MARSLRIGAWRSRPSRSKSIKQAAGSTLNDVVMSVCSGALRRYLLRKGTLPEQSLIAMVPVSVRTGEEEEI